MSELRQIHEAIGKKAQKTADIKDAWTTDSYIERYKEKSYDSTFKEALRSTGARNITEFLKKKKAGGQGTNCLDLMGSAIYPNSANYIDSAIGVRIKESDTYLKSIANIVSPDSTKDIEASFEHEKRRVIEGNMFSRKTVNDIKHVMEETDIPSFDLITCRPDGPFRTKALEKMEIVDNDSLAAYYAVQLKRYASLLSDNGMMLVQVPQSEPLYPRLEELDQVFDSEDISCEIFNSDYPENSKVLLVKKG